MSSATHLKVCGRRARKSRDRALSAARSLDDDDLHYARRGRVARVEVARALGEPGYQR
jgi:hypothetical protein